VQYGFARHKTGARVVVIDEPLMIFAALTWLEKQNQFSLLDSLRREIHMHSTCRNGFEAYLAYYCHDTTNSSAVVTRDGHEELDNSSHFSGTRDIP